MLLQQNYGIPYSQRSNRLPTRKQPYFQATTRFHKKRSTTSNLLESRNDWTISLSRRTNVIVAFIDFARAFDSICNSKLILKLRSYGISGNLLSWLTSFLVGRMQCVRVGTALSDFRHVTRGIPQGSCSGP